MSRETRKGAKRRESNVLACTTHCSFQQYTETVLNKSHFNDELIYLLSNKRSSRIIKTWLIQVSSSNTGRLVHV